MKKLLVDGFTTKIACPTGSFRVLVYPSGVDVSHLYPALPVRLHVPIRKLIALLGDAGRACRPHGIGLGGRLRAQA